MQRTIPLLFCCGFWVLVVACQRQPTSQPISSRDPAGQTDRRASSGPGDQASRAANDTDTDTDATPVDAASSCVIEADTENPPSTDVPSAPGRSVTTEASEEHAGTTEKQNGKKSAQDGAAPAGSPSEPPSATIGSGSSAAQIKDAGNRVTPKESKDKDTDGEQEPMMLDDAPLLLEDTPNDASAKGPVADNSRCLHCHLNMADEKLATTHARANIGCANCHGNCDAHIADESWASGGNGTAPEIMYPRDKIQAACMKCHPRDKIDIEEHEQWLAEKSPDKVCTDCHGEHRIVGQRKCKWK